MKGEKLVTRRVGLRVEQMQVQRPEQKPMEDGKKLDLLILTMLAHINFMAPDKVK